jgi:hypothetical protein
MTRAERNAIATVLTERLAAGHTVTDEDQAPFRRAVDALAEAVAVVRLVVTDSAVVAAAEAFQAQAKNTERSGDWEQAGSQSQLMPLLQAYERGDSGHLTQLCSSRSFELPTASTDADTVSG